MDRALDEDPNLDGLRGYADDTGEGRWTVEEAIRLAVPMNVIAASLFARFASRQDDSPAMKAVAALRNEFGGHAVTKVAKGEEKFKINGGFVDGKALDVKGVEALSKLPTKDELRSSFLALLVAAPQNFLALLQAAPQQMLGVMAAREHQLGEGGGK